MGQRSWNSGPGPGAVPTGRFPLRLWYNVPRAYMFDGKRCRKSLGLEKLAVGRNDLLPLRGTANPPSTLMVY